MGERTRFRRVIEGLEFPDPKVGWELGLLFPGSIWTGAGLDGEQAETSKAPPEVELFCLAGHISSLGPFLSVSWLSIKLVGLEKRSGSDLE